MSPMTFQRLEIYTTRMNIMAPVIWRPKTINVFRSIKRYFTQGEY